MYCSQCVRELSMRGFKIKLLSIYEELMLRVLTGTKAPGRVFKNSKGAEEVASCLPRREVGS